MIRDLIELWRKDNLLEQAIQESYEMLDRTHSMYRAAVASLRNGEGEKESLDVYAEDQLVNRDETEIRRKVLKHLAITGQVNVGAGLVLTTIVIDIERIGDYTKNILELALAHPDRLHVPEFEDSVKKVEASVTRLFERTRAVLESSDEAEARALIADSGYIRQVCDGIDETLIRNPRESLSTADAVALALYVRYLKRVGAHLMNILSSVANPFERVGYEDERTAPGGD